MNGVESSALVRIPTVIACCITLCTSVWLLLKLHHLSMWLRRRNLQAKLPLLGQQLWTISFGDLFFSVSELIFQILIFARNGLATDSHGALMWTCSAIGVMDFFSICISMLAEMHLAVVFTLSILGYSRSLHTLGKCVIFVLPVSFMCSIAELASDGHLYFDSSKGCAATKRDWWFFSITVVTVGVCFLGYFLSTVHVLRTAGLAVRRRVFKRTHCYVLVVLICLMPFVGLRIYHIICPVKVESRIVIAIVYPFFYLRGSGNMLLYVFFWKESMVMLQRSNSLVASSVSSSRSASRWNSNRRSLSNVHGFNQIVNFRFRPEVVEVDAVSVESEPRLRPEVVEVEADQSEVLLESLAMLMGLEVFEDCDEDLQTETPEVASISASIH